MRSHNGTRAASAALGEWREKDSNLRRRSHLIYSQAPFTARGSRQAAPKFSGLRRNLSPRVAVYGAMAAIDAPPPALPPSMLAAMADETLVGLVAAGSDDAFA